MHALTTVDDLVRDGLAPASDTPALDAVAAEFKIRISAPMRAAITGPQDAVARQFVPSVQELVIRPGELADPIGDSVHAPVTGLTHRYPDRVILHATHTCEVYCRFCFRREVVGGDGTLPDADLDAAIAYIARTPAIWEVILTGGDPLVLSPRRLGDMIARLAQIPHVEVIRLHSRVPVVAPDKITPALLAALQVRPAVYLVIHTNHAAEITADAEAAFARLVCGGVVLLSQSVLLRGVNDNADVLEALFRALIRNRVKPYYLHHCDLARGTSHFRTTIAEGQALMTALRGRMSGTCLPLYVLDIPGGHGKVPIGPQYLGMDDQGWQVRDPNGGLHSYHDPDR